MIAPFVLPDTIERILWLDADIIVKGDISELYYSNMENPISVVRDMGSEDLVESCSGRLRLKPDTIYFNSGVILFDLVAFRSQWTKCSFLDVLKGIIESGCELIYPDQDILNLIFEHKRNILPECWNYQIRSWTSLKDDEIENETIIHYVGKIKPWHEEYGNRAKKLWWDTLRKCGLGNGFCLLCMKNIYLRNKRRTSNMITRIRRKDS